MNYEKELSNIENSISNNLCRLRMFGEGSTVYADEMKTFANPSMKVQKNAIAPEKGTMAF